jgi:hypothetical protein
VLVALLSRPLQRRGLTLVCGSWRGEPGRGGIGQALIALGGAGGSLPGTPWVAPPLLLLLVGVCVVCVLAGAALF